MLPVFPIISGSVSIWEKSYPTSLKGVIPTTNADDFHIGKLIMKSYMLKVFLADLTSPCLYTVFFCDRPKSAMKARESLAVTAAGLR